MTHRGPHYNFVPSNTNSRPLRYIAMRLLKGAKRNERENVHIRKHLQFPFNRRRRTLTFRIRGNWRNRFGRDVTLFPAGPKPSTNRNPLATRTQEG